MIDGQPTDYLFGSFEFETSFRKEGDQYVAFVNHDGHEYSAKHHFQEQALNDLNAILAVAMEKGEFRPNQG